MSSIYTRIGVALEKMLRASTVDDDARTEIRALASELQTFEGTITESIAAQAKAAVDATMGDVVARVTALEARADGVDAGLEAIDQLIEANGDSTTAAASGNDTIAAAAPVDAVPAAPAKDEVAAAAGDAPVTDAATGVVTEPAPIEPAPAANAAPVEPAPETDPAPATDAAPEAPAADPAPEVPAAEPTASA